MRDARHVAVLVAAIAACGGPSRTNFVERAGDTSSQWAIAIDGDAVSGLAIASDAEGGVVVAGGFEGRISIGDRTLSSAGGQDAFVARLTADGKTRWARSFGGKGTDRAAAVTVSDSGMTFVAGEFSGSALFAGETRTAVGTADGFVAAIDPNGAELWVAQLGGPAYINPTQIAASQSDDAIVTGYFSGSMEVADSTLNSGGALDAFVVSIDNQGNAVWGRRAGGLGADTAAAIAIAPSGEIAVGGSFTEEADFAGLPLLARDGDVDGFVAVLSPAGEPVWAHGFGGAGTDAVTALSFDEAGNLYVVGSFADAIDFGTGPALASAGNHDAFVAKLSLAGDGLWSAKVGGAGADRALRVAAGDEVVVVAGTFENSAALGDNSVEARGRHDVFVAKLSAGGVPMWLRGIGGGEQDTVGGLTIASDQRVGVTGSFVADTNVGGTRLKATATTAAFVAKLAP